MEKPEFSVQFIRCTLSRKEENPSEQFIRIFNVIKITTVKKNYVEI